MRGSYDGRSGTFDTSLPLLSCQLNLPRMHCMRGFLVTWYLQRLHFHRQ